MTLRIIPPSTYAHTIPLPISAPSAPGIHDTLRAKLNLALPPPPSSSILPTTVTPNPAHFLSSSSDSATGLQSNHPLERRLRSWAATQDSLQQEIRRRNFGIAAAVRSAWDLQVVKQSMWTPLTLGGGCGVIEDVLTGRDCEVSFDDVFGGGVEFREPPAFHTELEGRMRMNW